MDTREYNECHAPFLGDYSITNKLTRASECDVALERYRIKHTNTQQNSNLSWYIYSFYI